MEASPGAFDAHPRAMEANYGALGAHHGAMDAHSGAVDAHPAAKDAHPKGMEGHPGFMEAHLEKNVYRIYPHTYECCVDEYVHFYRCTCEMLSLTVATIATVAEQ